MWLELSWICRNPANRNDASSRVTVSKVSSDCCQITTSATEWWKSLLVSLPAIMWEGPKGGKKAPPTEIISTWSWQLNNKNTYWLLFFNSIAIWFINRDFPTLSNDNINLRTIIGSGRGALNLAHGILATHHHSTWAQYHLARFLTIPDVTTPKTTCRPSNQLVFTVVMKNCEPLVSLPALAILSHPGPSCFSLKFSSLNLFP